MAEGHVRILLGASASEALTATGEAAFAIIGKASHPDDPTRWVLHLIPVDKALADQACGVILGTHKATRVRSIAKGDG